MSVQETSKENPSKVIKESEGKKLEIESQGSQNHLARKPGPKEAVKSPGKSSGETQASVPELETRMRTRSTKATSSDDRAAQSVSKNMVTGKGQQESTNKKLCLKKLAHEAPKGSEQLNRRSQRLQQLTECCARSLRSRQIRGQVLTSKPCSQPVRRERCNSTTQSKPSKVKISQKHVKRKAVEIKSDCKEAGKPVPSEGVKSPKAKKRRAEHHSADARGSRSVPGSEPGLQKMARKEEAKPVPENSEIPRSKVATSVVSKQDELKRSVPTQEETSTTPPKLPQPPVPGHSAEEVERAGKSKRGSILQLCEEIAGEIESDTVEVKRASSPRGGVKEEEPAEARLEEADAERQVLHQKETNRAVPCNRFFPSRKTKPVKCILNGINSSAKKNSTWTKIKLSKCNSVQQNKLDSHGPPKLGIIRTGLPPPVLEMPHLVSQSTFLETKPQDKKITCQQGKKEEIKSEEIKIHDVGAEISKTTNKAPENCHLDNHIKPSLDPLLDNQMKPSESVPDKNVSCLASKLKNIPTDNATAVSALISQTKIDDGEKKIPGSAPKQHSVPNNEIPKSSTNRDPPPNHSQPKCNSHLEITIPKDLKLKESEKADENQLVIDAGQKRFGAVSCNICGMLYTASNPEDETQHLLFHNQFISAVKYVVLLTNRHECGSEEEFITSLFF